MAAIPLDSEVSREGNKRIPRRGKTYDTYLQVETSYWEESLVIISAIFALRGVGELDLEGPERCGSKSTGAACQEWWICRHGVDGFDSSTFVMSAVRRGGDWRSCGEAPAAGDGGSGPDSGEAEVGGVVEKPPWERSNSAPAWWTENDSTRSVSSRIMQNSKRELNWKAYLFRRA